MEDDPLRYDLWIEEALRTVIRRAINLAAEQGLPGEHHFYVTFRTDDEGVEIPSNDFTELRTELDVRRLGGTQKIKNREWDFALYVRNDFYPATLEIPLGLGEITEVRSRWQLGFTWGPLEQWSPWWKIKMPRIGLAALFGDGSNGYRLIIRFRY